MTFSLPSPSCLLKLPNESNTARCETQQFMHTNDQSYRDQEPQQIHRIHENDKKQSYSGRVLDVEHGLFTPLVFTNTGGIGKECMRYHSRLAEMIAAKNGEHYSQTVSWIQARTPFALLRSALVCLHGLLYCI